MNKLDINLEKTKKYVVACSFGPDSMALLSSIVEQGYDVVVAHVNYRKREAAIFEQERLEQYCNEKNIKIYVLDLLGEKYDGNFQEWAREKRYKFFKEVAQKEKADAVLVAHQQDDLIETYLLQKKRGNISKNAGISGEIELFGIKIVRPLLSYTKQELKDFDDENNVPYSIDESNLTDQYSRNKIRHEIVEKLTDKERQELLKEIESLQPTDVELKTIWSKNDFLELTYKQMVRLLDYYMEKTKKHVDISEKFINEVKKAFKAKTNCRFDISSKLRLETDYGDVYFVNLEKLQSYEFKINESLKNEFLEIDFSKGAEDRNIPSEVKNLTVKNTSKNTKVIIKDYKCSINRLFIDWKVPHFLREVWPAICDENGVVLYVPRYRKEFTDTHKSKFIFKVNYFTEF